MNHHPDSDQSEPPARPADGRPKAAPAPGHDPRAATGNGIGSDPSRETAPAGTDPAGGPGTAPASEGTGQERRAGEDADGEPQDTAVGGPDRHNATESDPSATATPPGRGGATHPAGGPGGRQRR